MGWQRHGSRSTGRTTASCPGGAWKKNRHCIIKENTIIFEVRYCKAIKAMQQHLKDYYIKFEGEVYDIFASDFRRNERQYVQLKANRRD